MKNILQKICLIAVLLGIASGLNKTNALQYTLDWIEGFGAWGPAIFIGVYILACIFFVPSFIFTFSGGILFGIPMGFALSVTGTALGSIIAFLIGRYLAHDFVQKKVEGSAEFYRLARALKKKGWKVILLARFSPVFPFSIGNYAFGVTSVKARHYFIATLLGTIPSALTYTYLGFVTGDFASLSKDGRARTLAEWALICFGLVATFLLAWYLRRIAEKSSSE